MVRDLGWQFVAMQIELTAEESARMRDISFVGICCVVLQHFCLLTGYAVTEHGFFRDVIWQGILDWPVSWFFTVSGFFFVKEWDNRFRWWRIAIAKRIKTLALPYLIWCMIGVVIMYFYGREMSVSMMGRYIGITSAFPVIAPLWYVRNLMVFCILAPMIVPACKWLAGQRWGMILMLSLMFCLMLLPLPAKRLWVMSILYFTFGILVSFGGKFPVVDRRVILGGLCGVLLVVVCNSLFWRMELSATRYVLNFFIIASIWMFSEKIFSHWHISSNLSKCSFFVYCAHGIIMVPIYNSPSLLRCQYGDLTGIVLWIMVSIGTLGFTVLFACIIRACCPMMFKVLTGGRG